MAHKFALTKKCHPHIWRGFVLVGFIPHIWGGRRGSNPQPLDPQPNNQELIRNRLCPAPIFGAYLSKNATKLAMV
jgi:hypothetical protein